MFNQLTELDLMRRAAAELQTALHDITVGDPMWLPAYEPEDRYDPWVVAAYCVEIPGEIHVTVVRVDRATGRRVSPEHCTRVTREPKYWTSEGDADHPMVHTAYLKAIRAYTAARTALRGI
jgi:hypothetical protein